MKCRKMTLILNPEQKDLVCVCVCVCMYNLNEDMLQTSIVLQKANYNYYRLTQTQTLKENFQNLIKMFSFLIDFPDKNIPQMPLVGGFVIFCSF